MNRIKFLKKLAPYFILLLALAIRLYRLDLSRYSHDSAIPFSYGIRIVEAIADRNWKDIPLLSLVSGVRVQNPVGASFFWALVAYFDRSPYSGTVISVLLNVLGVAMLYDLGRKLLGARAGVIAAMLMATSIYSIYISRATWIQGQLEFCCVCAAWLIMPALAEHRPRRLLAGFVFTSFAMQTYLAAMAVAVPVTLCTATSCLLSPTLRRAARKPFAIGFAACVVSVLFFAAILLAQGASSVQDFSAVYAQENAPPPPVQRTDRRIDLDAITYALQIAGGVDFDFSKELMGFWVYGPDTLAPNLNRIYVTIVAALAMIGAIRLASSVFRITGRRKYVGTGDGNEHLAASSILIWFFWGIVLSIILVLVLPRLEVRPQYMLLTAPAGYLLAAAAFIPRGLPSSTLEPNRETQLVPARALSYGAVTLCALAALNGIPRVLANYGAIQKNLFVDRLDFLPIGAQVRLARVWRADCIEIANPQLQFWTAASFQTAKNIRFAGAENDAQSDVWIVRNAGGTCTSRISTESAPVLADVIPVQLSPNTLVNVYRSAPINEATLASQLGAPNFRPLHLNLEWTLLAQSVPKTAHAGETISVTQAWRIDSLPADLNLDAVHFTQFVDLKYPNGTSARLLSNGHLTYGRLWRPGDFVLGRLTPTLPADLPPGNYELSLSLFDGKLQKNAVYFDLNERGEPIWDKPMIAITRPLVIL